LQDNFNKDEFMSDNKKRGEEEKRREKLLSREEQKGLALRTKAGDKEACSKLTQKLMQPLKGYIRGKIAGSKVLDINQAQDMADTAFDRAIDRYNPQWKELFYNFLKKNADIVIENKLALMAQDGDKQALLEVFLWLDKPLVSFIKKECPHLDHGAAEGIAWQAWDRFLNAGKYNLSKFNPDGKQSFFDYLKNKAKTVIDHNNQSILESVLSGNNDSNDINYIDIVASSSTTQLNSVARLELLRLMFSCCAKPHMLLATGFVKLLEWRPREIVDELSDWNLGRLSERFCLDYYQLSQVYYSIEQEEFLYLYCFGLLQKVQSHIPDVYPEPSFKFLQDLPYTFVKEIPFRTFYGKDPAKSIHDWSYKVKERTRKVILGDILLCKEGTILKITLKKDGKIVKKIHIKTGKILAYVADKLTEKEAIEVDRHLAECTECAQRVRVHYYIKDHFDELWNSWTASRYSEELLRSLIYNTVKGKVYYSEVQKKIDNWLNNFRKGIQAALNVVLDSSRQKAWVALENLKSLVPSQGHPVLEPVPVPLKILGKGEGQPVKVMTQGPPELQVTIDPAAQKISVRMELSEEKFSPIILLIPKTRGEIFISEFRHPEGTDYLLADFEDVLDGEYSLILGRTSFYEPPKV